MFTGLVADLGTVTAVDATADGVRLAVADLARRRAQRGRLGRGQRRLPDRDGDRRRRASPPTSCTSRCAAPRWPRSAPAPTRQPRAAAARRRPARRPRRAGPRRRRRRRCATTREDGFARVVTFDAPPELLRYVVEKGSIAVDGVSLTVSRDRRRLVLGLADPRDARAHDARARPRPAGPSTWRWTCSPSTWRSSCPMSRPFATRRGGAGGDPRRAGWSSSATTRTARTRAT